MPRIYTSASDPVDFCQRCFPQSEDEAVDSFGLEQCGAGPDEWGDCFGYDAEHPDYDGEDYRCHICKRSLAERDN